MLVVPAVLWEIFGHVWLRSEGVEEAWWQGICVFVNWTHLNGWELGPFIHIIYIYSWTTIVQENKKVLIFISIICPSCLLDKTMVSIFLWHLGYLQESTWMFVLFFALLLALWIIWWLQWFFAGTSLDADRWVAGVIEFDGGREDNHDKPCIDIVYVYVFNCLYIYISQPRGFYWTADRNRNSVFQQSTATGYMAIMAFQRLIRVHITTHWGPLVLSKRLKEDMEMRWLWAPESSLYRLFKQ